MVKLKVFKLTVRREYSYEKKKLFSDKTTHKTGNFEYNPFYVVATNQDNAMRLAQERYEFGEKGKVYDQAKIESNGKIKDISDAKLINITCEIKQIVNVSFDELKEKLIFEDFVKIWNEQLNINKRIVRRR